MDPINLHNYEALAKERLKPEVWDFIDGAYGDEVTKRRNRAALDEVTVNPNFLVDVGERDLTTTVLGEETSFPVMISPAGGQMIAHPDGSLLQPGRRMRQAPCTHLRRRRDMGWKK